MLPGRKPGPLRWEASDYLLSYSTALMDGLALMLMAAD
jgi:hypothetical protein